MNENNIPEGCLPFNTNDTVPYLPKDCIYDSKGNADLACKYSAKGTVVARIEWEEEQP